MSDSEVLIAEGPALLALRDGVAHLQLNRPESANGLNLEMLEGLRTALQRVQGEPRARVVLLSGQGKNFCAGGDVHTFAAQGEALPYYIRQATSLLEVVVGLLVHLDTPVVCAAQGYTAGGGGMGLLCASDIVFASESSKFLCGATRVAMAPDAGLSVTLPRLIGARRAADWLLMNPTVDSKEALESGLVNRVMADAELAASAMSYAQQMAEGAPRALAATKRLLWTGVGLGIEAAMPEEARTVADLCRTQDVQEGLRAVIEKRAPKFTGR